jgi:hypothetical protein
MAKSSASSGLVSSSLLSSSLPSLDAKLDRLVLLKQLVKEHQAEIDAINDDLDQLVESGEAETEIVWNDHKITRRSLKSYTYPGHILEQREQLKASERLSVALGEAQVTLKYFWEVRGA